MRTEGASGRRRGGRPEEEGRALRDRVHGCLLGVALGDAMGMPSEGMPPDRVRDRFGWIDDLRPGTDRGLAAGQVTDDTEQTVMLARAILADGGHVRAETVAEHLLAWVDHAGARADAVIGPSTARAVAALRRGADPRTTGRAGTTNGAAMRVAPVGVLHRPDDLPALVDGVVESCVMSHHTGVAISGACLVAGAVSAALEEPDGAAGVPPQVVETALRAAQLGAGRGERVPGPTVVEVARRAVDLAVGAADDATFLRRLDAEVGTSVTTAESVPAALGCLVRGAAEPYRVAVLAANLGGDTDTIGAMAAGIAGALRGTAGVPDALASALVRVNGLELAHLAEGLAAARRS